MAVAAPPRTRLEKETHRLHAAAGGLGLITSQWLAHLGATVIGTVGTDEKVTGL